MRPACGGVAFLALATELDDDDDDDDDDEDVEVEVDVEEEEEEKDEDEEEKEKDGGTLEAPCAGVARGEAGICVACAGEGEEEEEGDSRACIPSTRARALPAERVTASGLPSLPSPPSPVSTLRACACACACASKRGRAASPSPASPHNAATSCPSLWDTSRALPSGAVRCTRDG